MDSRLLGIIKIMDSLENPNPTSTHTLGIDDLPAVEYVLNQVRGSRPVLARLIQNISSTALLTQIFDTCLSDSETISLLTDPEISVDQAVRWITHMSPDRQNVVWPLIQAQHPSRYRDLKAQIESGIQITRGVIIENFNIVHQHTSAAIETERLLDLIETADSTQKMNQAATQLLATQMGLLPEVLTQLSRTGPTLFSGGIQTPESFFRFLKWCFLVDPLLPYDETQSLAKSTLTLLHKTLLGMPSVKWVDTILEQIPPTLSTGYIRWFSRQKNVNAKIKSAVSARTKGSPL